jgi:hypothetical protein
MTTGKTQTAKSEWTGRLGEYPHGESNPGLLAENQVS